MVAKAKSMRPRAQVKNVRKSSRTRGTKTLLFRLRPTDTRNGVSARTLKELAAVLGVPETQVIHQALRKLADDFIPAYEADDGPVSDETLNALKARVPQDQYKTVTSTLFPE